MEICLNFLLWVLIFVVVSYNVYEKVYKLIFSISAQNHSDFSDFSGNSCAGMAIFAISKLLFVEFPDYSGFSLRIWRIIDVFGTCNEH